MVYILTFKKRGDITDDQKAGLTKKLKMKIMKEKDTGSKGQWLIKAGGKITDEDLAKALRFYKISKEMSNAELTEK